MLDNMSTEQLRRWLYILMAACAGAAVFWAFIDVGVALFALSGVIGGGICLYMAHREETKQEPEE